MQIEIDFDVFKALTAHRENEADSYNAVLRRLLKLPSLGTSGANSNKSSEAFSAFGPYRPSTNQYRNALGALRSTSDGAWFDNIHLPNGTQFRATYKGQLFTAEVKGNHWVGHDGIVRTSPSAAASAISNTTVNGWRFWYFKRPGDPDWARMDSLKS